VEKIIGKLVIEVLPEGAAKVAKVSIDGTDIEGMTWELDMTEMAKGKKVDQVKKEVKVVVKASGYRDGTSKIDVLAEKDTTLKVELVKRSTNVGTNTPPRPQVPVVPPTGGNKPPTGGNKPPPPKCKKPPCGLIDI
jgi:hypothetical protein